MCMYNYYWINQGTRTSIFLMTRSPSTTLPAMIIAGVGDQVNVEKSNYIEKKMAFFSKIMHIVGNRKRGKGLLQISLL